MPKFDTKTETATATVGGKGGFNFSFVAPDKLEATEYTLVSIVIDVTGSVTDFAQELNDCLKMIIEDCRKSPRANNLLVRAVTFNDTVREIHGFIPLSDIDTKNDYDDFKPYGVTALYDATGSAADATLTYAKTLTDQDYDVNAIIVIVTDGADNDSRKRTPGDIATTLQEARNKETMESILTILVGIKDATVTGSSWASGVEQALDSFKNEAKLDQFVNAGDMTKGRLAKIAGFISQSVSSQSSALGTGGPSQTLKF